ncbi:helix-turn-helix transcriptional regulator, partial [bacterium]|nr:helix-turn-helix transcriptional regulator [bacterium]
MKEHEKIKKIRTKLNLTQQEMADALGVSKQYFSKVENGHTQLSKEKISIFSDKYGVSLDWLVNNKGQMFYQDEENIAFADNMDNFVPLVNHISLYNSYIIAVS